MLTQSIKRNELLRCISSILDFIEDLSAKEYYSQSVAELFDAYRLALSSLNKWLVTIDSTQLLPKHSDEIHNILIDGISTSLRYIQRSQTKYTPWSILPLIEDTVSRIYDDQRIVIRPKWRWLYQIAIKPMNIELSELLAYMCANDASVKEACDKLQNMKRIRFVSFPIMEVENYIAHILLYHEVGHLIQEEMFVGVIPDLLSKMTYDKNRGDDDDKNARQIAVYINMFLQEVIPDVVAYLLIGPAYYLSLFTALNYSLVKDSDKLLSRRECSEIYMSRATKPTYPHPPLKLRLMYLYDHYFSKDMNNKYKGYHRLSLFQKCTIRNYQQSIAEYSYREPNIEIAYNCFEIIMKDVKPKIEQKLTGLLYSGSSPENIEYLLEKLKNDIPPVELIDGSVAEIGDVFLASFFYIYYDIIREESSPLVYCKKMKILNKLLKFTFNGIRYKGLYNACAT